MGVELKGNSEVNSRAGQSKGNSNHSPWNTVEHCQSQLLVKDPAPTEYSLKREVLNSITAVFNPLGFFTPATLQGKLFLQELLWASEKEWDEKLEEEMLHKLPLCTFWTSTSLVMALASMEKILLPHSTLILKVLSLGDTRFLGLEHWLTAYTESALPTILKRSSS